MMFLPIKNLFISINITQEEESAKQELKAFLISSISRKFLNFGRKYSSFNDRTFKLTEEYQRSRKIRNRKERRDRNKKKSRTKTKDK